MKKEVAALLILLLLTLPLAGCFTDGPGRAAAATELDERLLAANTGFAFKLLPQLLQGSPGENVFFSPASVALALAMTYNGAAGVTQEEMARVMGIENMSLAELNTANRDLLSILENPDRGVQTLLANSLWPAADAELLPDFVDRITKYYKAEVSSLDYTEADAVKTINKWVAKRTKDKIPQLFNDLSPTTRLVLVNALYFKAAWSEPFKKGLTHEAPFYLEDGSTVTVPMMHREGTFYCLEGAGFKAVRLPYGKEGRVAMYVFVPEEGPDAFVASLTPENWQTWLSSFRPENDAQVFLPRFSTRFSRELNEPLKQLGMEAAFSDKADFSGMTPGGGWFISLVKHEAVIDVNEEGTEAAAATGVAMDEAAVLDPFILRADKPFVFAVCDEMTETILFLGIIKNPQ
ncbi:MAG: serpin family protein [Firmicutes bacterium]|jgi:serpin B|nr:serpin family protein [Bacillota bacterium]